MGATSQQFISSTTTKLPSQTSHQVFKYGGKKNPHTKSRERKQNLSKKENIMVADKVRDRILVVFLTVFAVAAPLDAGLLLLFRDGPPYVVVTATAFVQEKVWRVLGHSETGFLRCPSVDRGRFPVAAGRYDSLRPSKAAAAAAMVPKHCLGLWRLLLYIHGKFFCFHFSTVYMFSVLFKF